MYLARYAAPAAELLTLTEVKAHLRINNTKSDTWLTTAIALATAMVDGDHGHPRRALITQTWNLTLRDWPIASKHAPDYLTRIPLPLPPLQSVTHVKYYDADNIQQTLSSDLYRVVIEGTDGGRIEQANTATWPAVYDRPDAIEIRFVAGYGDAASAVPVPIKHAMLLAIGDQWANRGDAERPTESPGPGMAHVGAGWAAGLNLMSRYIVREFP